MADLLQHRITVQANANVNNVPHFTVEARVVDSGNQNIVIADLTGANAIDFVCRVQGMSVADHRELVEMIALWLIQKRAGLL